MSDRYGWLDEQVEFLTKCYSRETAGFTLLSEVHHYAELQRGKIAEEITTIIQKENCQPTNRSALTDLAKEYDIWAEVIEEVVNNIRYLRRIDKENKTGIIHS